MKKTLKTISFILIVFSFLFSVSIIWTLRNKEDIEFTSVYKETPVTLKATYYKVNKPYEYAVLIAPGYSCDRAKWKPIAKSFVENGLPTMLFDYSGQGGSYGVIGFDNAKTDAIPKQIDTAIEKLMELSGVDEKHIILVGHSMGGRAILRLLYDYNRADAQTLTNYKDIRNVILMSPEVNYHYNAQASLFAGTSDEVSEPWKSYSVSDIGNASIYLYGSLKDDIVSSDDVNTIYQILTGEEASFNTVYSKESKLNANQKIEINIVDSLLHSYFMYSDRISKMVNNNLEEITDNASSFNPMKMNFAYTSWILGLIGIGIYLHEINKEKEDTYQSELKVKDGKRFLLSKLLLWIPGTIVSFIICCICVVLPFGSPVMNIPYMNFIAGYGITMLIFYKLNKVKGASGNLEKITFKINFNLKDAFIIISILVVIWSILYATMYNLFPLNWRLFWLIFSSILMTIGFYVSSDESEALKNSSMKNKILYNLNQYIPLFLLVAFYLVLKSYSGMIGQMCNMIFLYTIAIPLGNYIKKISNNRLFGSFMSALVFQSFMITSAALIAIL